MQIGLIIKSLQKMKKTLFLILALLLSIAVKAQDFKNFYTIGKDGSIELDITNYDFHERFYTVYNIYNDSRFKISEGKANGLFKINSEEDINSYLANLHSDFSKLDKYDLDDMLYWAKAYLPEEYVTSMLLDIAIENNRGITLNDHCADSDPFCTSEIIQFTAPANVSQESIPDAGCLHTRPCPAWFHMRINNPGQFIIHMEGVDPASGQQRDIDFCLWGPFNNPTTPCTAQLTTNKIIDCSYSGNNTEDAYLGYQSGHNHHGSNHGTVNYHLPESGEYYILLITNYSQQNCRISFTKQANSGPGTTDCSIIEPFLTANSPCIGSTLVLEANVIEGASYTWTSPDNQTHNGRTWTRQNATLAMAGSYTCHVVAGTQSGDENINVFVLPNVTANFTNTDAVAGQAVQFTGTETTNPSGHTNEINVRQWTFGDGTTSNQANPTHTYATPGDYQVTYYVAITGGNDGECGDTKTKTIQIRNEFNATVTSDNTSFCDGDATPNLTASASGGYGNYTYSWTSSPSCPIDYPNSATTTAHPAIGNTTFTCTVSDGHSTLNKSVTVTVNAIPDVTITGPNPPHVNFNASTTLSVPQLSGATYEWSSEPANLIQSGQNTNQITTKNLTEPTTFYVTVSKNGCSDSNSLTLAVGDALYGNVVIVGQAELCSGETTSLMVNPSGGTEQYSFNWQPANMIEGSNTTQTITTKALTSSLSYTCTITDTDSHTYAATSPTIVVNPIPEAMAYVQESGNIYKTFHILAGNSVVLNMENIPGATYSWEPANLIREFLENNHRVARTYDLEENDNLVFTATVTSSSGCVNQDNVTIVVHQALDESYIASSVDVICEDHAVTLTVNPSGGTGDYSYYWLPSSGGIYSDPYSQTTTVYPNSSNHSYRCIISDNGIDDKENNWIEKSIDLAIYEKPSVNNTLIGQEYVIPGIDYMPYIYEYNIRVSSLHGYNIENAEYTWELFSYYDTPNHVSGTECTSTWQVFPDDLDKNKAYVSVDEYGNALLRCTITTECGSTKSERFIYTEDYNQGQSVDEINYDKMVSVFPNPSNGEVYIGYNEKLVSKDIVISIYNYNGMLIDQIKANTDTNVTHYSMSDMSNGLYIVKITGNDFVVTKKFVLNK